MAVEKVEGKAGHPASVRETPVSGMALGVGTGGRGCLCLGCSNWGNGLLSVSMKTASPCSNRFCSQC